MLSFIHNNTSQKEIDDFATKAAAAIDWLSRLQNELNAIPIFREGILSQLITTIIERLPAIQERIGKGHFFSSVGEFFVDVFPECEAIKDGINYLFDTIDLRKEIDEVFSYLIVWGLDTEIIRSILSADASRLILVVTGDNHARHCAWLLENEGYEVLYAKRSPLSLKERKKQGVLGDHPVDGATLKCVLDSRDALRALQESSKDSFEVRDDLSDWF